MDSHTHIAFAVRLVEAAGGHRRQAIASLFPQIDRLPSTLHRLHAHTVFRARALASLGRALIIDSDHHSAPACYERTRFLDERGRLGAHMESLIDGHGVESEELSVLAFVSHLYLDTFNQPTQPFAPFSPAPCGQWDLWSVLGDFRRELYLTPVVNELRRELFEDNLWSELSGVSATAQLEAMLARMAACALVDSDSERAGLVRAGRAALRLPDHGGDSDVVRAQAIFTGFEARLCALHEKHLVSRSPVERDLRPLPLSLDA